MFALVACNDGKNIGCIIEPLLKPVLHPGYEYTLPLATLADLSWLMCSIVGRAPMSMKEQFDDNAILPPGMGIIKLPRSDGLPNMKKKVWVILQSTFHIGSK